MLPSTMRAMLLSPPTHPSQATPILQLKQVPIPAMRPDQVLVKVLACGICRTDLHVLDGELKQPKLPLIMGHQIVGEIVAIGSEVKAPLRLGMRVGIPWLGGTCGHCFYCSNEQENLCDDARYTGYQL
ncbi:MAG TPA: alcohol dehydrogenase catalytic domain-containing protein, partial [Pseudomonadales bacterium]|nr:alcohol dehydrogenase catalytic domain-containing protein [Pseudomonadales bacterium]